jgi:ssDNA-binding replication factor A large subunit
MTQENPKETLIQQILSKRPTIERQQILDRLAATRDMTGGLIADESLLRMIAAELGVEVANEDGSFKHRLSLGHLVTGLNNVTVTGRVVAVYPVRTFEGAKPGKFGSITIVDNDGVLRVVLWNEKANFLESGELKIGQIVKLVHGYTKADRFGVPELHIGERSQIEFNPQNVKEEDYPSIGKFATKISQITPEQKSVNIDGKITDVFNSSTFTRSDQTAGKVLRLKVSDDSGEVVAIFWNEKAEEVEPKAKRGTQIQIVNARIKLNPNDQDQVELHVDSSAYVTVSEAPKRLLKISALTSELSEVDVEGEVATLPVCREVKTSKGDMVKLTSFDLRDETGAIRVTAWREHAETACSFFMGEKISLENVYAKVGYNGKLELSTRTATLLTRI